MSNKLTLKKITAKNFRSVGNSPLHLDYQASPSTLIASEHNGSGKSTLAIWALYFALYGKPYKPGAKIASLVNSKSTKDCLVEVDFETAGAQWVVKRGYKPAMFEIHRDGKLIENEAANGDMQAYLNSVVGMDEKAFCNIVALGVDRFVPFVQMTATERRAFVEQMLDLIVISDMNKIAKEKAKALKLLLDQIHYDISMLESRKLGRERTVAILEEKKRLRLEESGAELETYRAEVAKLRGMIALADKKHDDILATVIPGTSDKLGSVRGMIQRFEGKLSDIKKSASNVINLHDCPTCKQGVTEAHKQLIEASAEAEAGKLAAPLEKLASELLKAQEDVEKNRLTGIELVKINNIKDNLKVKLSGNEMLIKQIESKMVDNNEDELIRKEQDEIVKLGIEISNRTDNLNAETKRERVNQQLLQVLKDDGIKASIVSQYLPFLNQSINAILDKLNLYVQINIDSEFNVSMFAPDRKNQTIDNLSTGQCRRIDLAVLLSWREIAKNKASADCNVLILDEILENLSASGVEEFMEMWELIGADTNLFVITQRAAEFDQHFDKRISYTLVNDMTVEV